MVFIVAVCPIVAQLKRRQRVAAPVKVQSSRGSIPVGHPDPAKRPNGSSLYQASNPNKDDGAVADARRRAVTDPHRLFSPQASVFIREPSISIAKERRDRWHSRLEWC
jgi:hypothetical protein